MQEKIATLRGLRAAAAGQPAPALAERWAAFDARGDQYPLPGDAVVTEVDAGGVPAHWITVPGADAGRVLLYLHGGGYQVGSFRSHAELESRLGRASGRPVLLPEYRLAPEHPFPAAVEDALAVWRWLRSVPRLSASALAVAGDSAKSAAAAGVDVTVQAGEGLPHVYPAMLGIPEAAEATGQAGAFLRDTAGQAG